MNPLNNRIIEFKRKMLTALLFDGGYVSFTKSGTGIHATYTPTYHFYMKDHLGGNRVVTSAAGVAEQVNHYYPYGSTFYGEKPSDHRFKYCGRSAEPVIHYTLMQNAEARLLTMKWAILGGLCKM